MSDQTSRPSSLQIWPIVREAVQLSWTNWKHFGFLIVIPSLFLAGNRYLQDIWIFQDAESLVSWSKLALLTFLTAPSAVIFSIFAIACHRSILLTPLAVTKIGYQGWSHRETRFVIYSLLLASLTWLGIGVSFFLALMASVFFAVICSSCPGVMAIWERLDWVGPVAFTFFFSAFLVGYPIGRLSLVLPATAIDRTITFKWAWFISEHHAGRLALLVGAVPFASLLLQTALSQLFPDTFPDPLQYLLEGFV